MTAVDKLQHAIEAPSGPRKMLIADRCMGMGFKIETVMKGVKLLVKALRSHPDILIVDVNMPELDRLSVCVRLLDPGRKPFEVIVVTGSPDPDTPERCESLGMFYARKGPDFWKGIETAITEIYSDMVVAMSEMEMVSVGEEVHERPRVLVVDDDPEIETFFASRLGKYGVDTLYAPDAVQGYRVAAMEKPSVIICDNFMPDGDAQFLLYRLRATPTTANIPLFVISGRQLGELAEQSLKREIEGKPGAQRVFRKSFGTRELFEALQKYFSFEKHGAQH